MPAAILIPISGSKAAEAVVRSHLPQARRREIGGIHLLNVQPDFTAYVSRFVGGRAIRDYQREEGERALAGTRRILDAAGIPYTAHIRVGDIAQTIVATASELGVGEIALTGDGDNWWGDFLARYTVSRVLRLSPVPVVVIKSRQPEPALQLSPTG